VSYTDLRDFEPETTFHISDLGGDHRDLNIAIAKSGGGTVGRAYEGLWRAVVTYDRREIYRGSELNTPLPRTHGEAAAVLAELLAADHPDTSLAARLSGFADHYLD
jgi:hypothetical protein